MAWGQVMMRKPVLRSRARDGLARVARAVMLTRARRAIAAGLVVALVGGVAWAADVPGAISEVVLASGDDAGVDANDEVVECPREAQTAAEASEIAERCGHDVMVLDSLTVYDTNYATPRGTFRQEASGTALRSAASGEWQPVNPEVVLDSSGTPTVTSAALGINFTEGGASGEVVSLDRDGLELSLGLPVGLGNPMIDPDDATRVIYPVLDATGAAIEGADLVVRVHSDTTGVTPVLRLDSAVAAAAVTAAAGPDGLNFDVGVSDGLELTDVPPIDQTGQQPAEVPGPTDGVFYAVSTSDAMQDDPLVFSGGQAMQWDSAGGAEAGSGAGRTAGAKTLASAQSDGDPQSDRVEEPLPGDAVVAMGVEIEPDGSTAAVAAETSMFTDAETVWPVFVDPPLTGTRNAKTAIKSAWPDSAAEWQWADSAGVGFCDVTKDIICERSGNVWRLIWQYKGLESIGAMDSTDIVSATFRAVGTHSYNCTKTPMDLHRVPPISTATTWNNHASSWSSSNLVSTKSDAYYSSACGGTHGTEWNATSAAKDVAANGWSTLNLGVKGRSTSNMESWKKLRWDAVFAVEYNRKPEVARGHQTLVDGSDVGCHSTSFAPLIVTTQPTLSVVGDDPDGGSVQVKFVVVRDSDGSRIWETTYWSKGQAAPARFSKTIPGGVLSSNVLYRWRAQVTDGSRTFGYTDSPACWFKVDINAPKPPKIEVVTPDEEPSRGIQAVYEQDKERGGTGQKGCFRFLPNGSTDVASYVYGFNTGNTYPSSVTADSAGKAIMCLSPTAVGAKTLQVKSVDDAGNRSLNYGSHEFDVAEAREDGIWTFDEGASPSEDRSVRTAGEATGAGDLAVTGPTWVQGPHGLFGARDNDLALRFDRDAAQDAVTEAPVLDTSQDFVVSAHVRLAEDADRAGYYAALSQDSIDYSGFWLGYRPTSCPDGTPGQGCWTFGLNTSSTTNAYTYLKSDREVRFGEWVHLLAEYSKTDQAMRLYVCDAGTPAEPAIGEPHRSELTGFTSAVPRTPGPLTVGRMRGTGSPSNPWDGEIDNVRVFKGEVLASAKIRRLCQGAEATGTAGDGIDPTISGEITQ